LSSWASKEFVVDSSAFYMGFPFQSSLKCYTTKAVHDEIEHIKKSYYRLEALIDAGNLTIKEPDQSFIEKVICCANNTGDKSRLSFADLTVLALALEMDRILVSDDYAIGNVAAHLKVQVKSISFNGIKELRKWTSYCSACHRTFQPGINICRTCGSKLRRRYKVHSA
jgi:endoribonuclease Nob1